MIDISCSLSSLYRLTSPEICRVAFAFKDTVGSFCGAIGNWRENLISIVLIDRLSVIWRVRGGETGKLLLVRFTFMSTRIFLKGRLFNRRCSLNSAVFRSEILVEPYRPQLVISRTLVRLLGLQSIPLSIRSSDPESASGVAEGWAGCWTPIELAAFYWGLLL
jgi:hypothetical protein